MTRPGLRSHTRATTHAIGGCYDCNGASAIWESKRAAHLARSHAAKTGHHTWAEEGTAYTFNRPTPPAEGKGDL